nr:hypothetical protein [Marisediminicola antarctica]
MPEVIRGETRVTSEARYEESRRVDGDGVGVEFIVKVYATAGLHDGTSSAKFVQMGARCFPVWR